MKDHLVLDAKFEEEGHGWFHWEIEDWGTLPKRVVSKTFSVAGHDWDILLFPEGNGAGEVVSIYVEYKPKPSQREQEELHAKKEGDDQENKPIGSEDWHCCAFFNLTISNLENPEVFMQKTAHHRFTPEEADWGFTAYTDMKFLPVRPDEGTPALVENGRVRISAYLRVLKDPFGVIWNNFHNWDSRKQTGYVGMMNQGATCYMNSLLQSLFFTNKFRNAVFQIPTEADNPMKSTALALQRVFYNLQASNTAAGTTELTKSFGWDSLESFRQHDVQELNRKLQENLEAKMKGTEVDGVLEELFMGKYKSYIRCVNVDYESSRVEPYCDISLDVRGCATLRDSFAKYCEVETMDGENKYQAEGFGLQDARKGLIFEFFPPVLHLHLKRFEYDFMRNSMVKINDRQEFPPSIDLSEFLSDDADRSKSWKYNLHGVLVHSGELHSGHYFALLRPTAEEKWYKFDDDRVIPVMPEEVFEEYFGGDPLPQDQYQQQAQPNLPGAGNIRNRYNSKRFTNVYMLVYVREACLDEVLSPGDAKIPEHLLKRVQFEKEEEERVRLEEEMLANTLPVKIVDNQNMKTHQGVDMCYFGERQPADNALFQKRMPLTMTLSEFKKHYASYLQVPEDSFRLWSLVGRINKTVRCEAPLVGDEVMDLTLAQLKNSKSLRWRDLRMYCEMRDMTMSDEEWNSRLAPETNMIHIKFYDPSLQKMAGLGHIYISADQQIHAIMPQMRQAAGLAPDTHIEVYEEVKPTLIERMDVMQTFRQAEIQTGDILCFQVYVSPEYVNEKGDDALTTIPQHFDRCMNLISVTFTPKPAARGDSEDYGPESSDDSSKPNGEAKNTFVLKATSKMPYEQVARWVADQLDMRDPLKLRFYLVGAKRQARQPVHLNGQTTLKDMVVSAPYQGKAMLDSEGLYSYTVMYEKLELSIMEMENMRSVRVTYVGRTMRDEHQLDILVPKTERSQRLIESTHVKVEQIIRNVSNRKEAAGLPPKPFKLRFYVASNHRILKELDGSENIQDLGNPGASDVIAEYIDPIQEQELYEQSSQMMVDHPMDENCISGPVPVEVFHYYQELNHAHSLPFQFQVLPNERWPDTWARLSKKLGLGEKELKSMGVVFGSPTDMEVRQCHVIRAMETSGNNNNNNNNITAPSTGQHTPIAETPPPPPPAQLDDTGKDLDHAAAALSNTMVGGNSEEDFCLWNYIRDNQLPGGFIGLNHIDRSSRHRGLYHEQAIRILN